MAKYFIDTEFLEGTQKSFFGRAKPTIDLISIAIVSDDGREYYAISKDFNLKEAWNRFDLKEANTNKNHSSYNIKDYWIRDNVLKPIYRELHDKENLYARQAFHRANIYVKEVDFNFTYKNLKNLINKYGKTNKQIAEEIKGFVYKGGYSHWSSNIPNSMKPEFYGYYSDYDWVVFCWLFGRMIALPKGFPMYCKDLKQTLDEKCVPIIDNIKNNINNFRQGISTYDGYQPTLEGALAWLERKGGLPKQINNHNALSDARWNHELYKFLEKL